MYRYSVPGPLRALPRTNGPALPESERFVKEVKWNRKSFQQHPVRLTWNAECRYDEEISWNDLSHRDPCLCLSILFRNKGLMKSFSEPHAPQSSGDIYYSWVNRLIFFDHEVYSYSLLITAFNLQVPFSTLAVTLWSLGPLVQLKSWPFAED